MNVAIVFSDFGPYHVARIEALASALEAQSSRLFAVQFTKLSTTYGWKPSIPAGVEVITLAPKAPIGFNEAFRMALAFRRALREQAVDVVFLPSYSPLPNLLCVLTAKLVGCKAVLMNESWHGTEKAGFIGRIIKHALVRSFDAALVGGTPQRAYARVYGQKPSKIFLGYDVVDVTYYARESERWRAVPVGDLPVPNLPARYFLNLGRFVPKKNITVLVQAYARLYQYRPAAGIALVLVGEGSEEETIRQVAVDHNIRVRNGFDLPHKATDGPEIVFYPFQQVDRTPLFFARCEAFILPSLYEEWGLVVNEAMACGTAVLVSKNVGCVQDLVIEGQNGFQFEPTQVDELAELMRKFVDAPDLARRLGACGTKIIGEWGPERFAEGAIKAIKSTN